MGRGAESKAKRKANKKKAAEEGDRFNLGEEDLKDNGDAGDFGPGSIPLPPGMAAGMNKTDDDSSDDSSEEGEKRNDAEELMLIRKKKAVAKPSHCCNEPVCAPKRKSADQGIKTTPLILLILMVGTTILPALIYASDYIGAFLQKNNVVGQIGFRLGMGAVPRKRVLSFYEKHDPNKLNEVPNILSKYYGDYPKLIKRLERKYQDYGYFLGWEEDEAPMMLAKEQIQETYSLWINSYWNVYAPQPAKTAARNIRYNLTFLHKKFYKLFWKKIWPHLEPFLGVPKGAEKQKRKDRDEARKRKERATGSSSSSSSSSGRKKYREDDEM